MMNETLYHISRCSKLACGRSYSVPSFGKVSAYRDSKSNKRRFKISGSKSSNGGNYSLDSVKYTLSKSVSYKSI